MWPYSGLGARLPAAHADGLDRVRADRPVDHVEVVDVLLDDVVAGEPGEVVPVAELLLHVGSSSLLARLRSSSAALVPVAPARRRSRRWRRRGSASSSRGSRPGAAAACRRRSPVPSSRQLGGREHRADAGPSTATGFSVKTCLPASIAAARWIGRKPGGVARITRSQSVAMHLLVGVEAGERRLGRRRHALGRELLAELALRPLDLVRKAVAEGGDHDVGRGR